MSRSNPQDDLPNPAKRIFEWHGGNGQLKCFDKDAKVTTTVTPTAKEPFVFILLDELGCVRGFDQQLNCGIYSNEIKDSRQDVLIVRRDKNETIAEGIFKTIKATVKEAGGEFHTALYVGYRNGKTLEIGVLRLKGAALNAWIEFRRKHRADVFKKAVVIADAVEGKNGAITFKTPKLSLKDITDTTQVEALELDKQLQAYLMVYLAKTKHDQAEQVGQHVRDEDMPSVPPLATHDDVYADDIPF